MRDRKALYSETTAGVENGYTLKIANKSEKQERYVIALQSPSRDLVLVSPAVADVAAGAVVSVPMTVSAPASFHGRREIHFDVSAADGNADARVDSSFFGPLQ